jgi:hypothetical protein
MKQLKQYPLRKIAESVLASHFGDLDPEVMQELATSLVRQWLTNDGHAGFVTSSHQHWFRAVPREDDGVEVGSSSPDGDWARVLSHDWQVDEDDVPELLHSLNLCQSALCRTADGRTIQVRVEPKERTVRCQEQPAEAE